jgi:hypothetical protein
MVAKAEVLRVSDDDDAFACGFGYGWTRTHDVHLDGDWNLSEEANLATYKRGPQTKDCAH